MERAFDYLFTAVLAFGGMVLGWLHVQRNSEAAEMKATIKAHQKALADHKLYAAETFARKGDVERALDKAEERLSEKIDGQGEAMLARLEEIRDRLPRRD